MLAPARILEIGTRKTVLHCDVFSGDELCADARIIAVNVGSAWDE